jgi:ribosomal protein L37AE/L43A
MVNAWYTLAILWVYLFVFLIACGLVFVFPQITLGLLFIGLAGLGFAVLGFQMLSGVEHSLARRTLSSGICPICRQPIAFIDKEEAHWRCEGCSVDFDRAGYEFPAPAPSR